MYGDRPLKWWNSSESPVLSLLPIRLNQNSGLVVSRSDGSVVLYYLSNESQTHRITFRDFSVVNKIQPNILLFLWFPITRKTCPRLRRHNRQTRGTCRMSKTHDSTQTFVDNLPTTDSRLLR